MIRFIDLEIGQYFFHEGHRWQRIGATTARGDDGREYSFAYNMDADVEPITGHNQYTIKNV